MTAHAPSYTASRGKVMSCGTELSDHRVEDLLTFFEERAREAEKGAADARKAFNDLWEARCAAMDARQDRMAGQ